MGNKIRKHSSLLVSLVAEQNDWKPCDAVWLKPHHTHIETWHIWALAFQWCGQTDGAKGTRSHQSIHKPVSTTLWCTYSVCVSVGMEKNRVNTHSISTCTNTNACTQMSRDCADLWLHHIQYHTVSTKHYKCRHTSCTCTGKRGTEILKINVCVLYVYVQRLCASVPRCVYVPVCVCCLYSFTSLCLVMRALSIRGCVLAMLPSYIHNITVYDVQCVDACGQSASVPALCGQTEPDRWMRNTYVLPHLKHPSGCPLLPVKTQIYRHLLLDTPCESLVYRVPRLDGWVRCAGQCVPESEPSWDDSFMDCTDETWYVLKHQVVT